MQEKSGKKLVDFNAALGTLPCYHPSHYPSNAALGEEATRTLTPTLTPTLTLTDLPMWV